jgi:hypothetical protein
VLSDFLGTSENAKILDDKEKELVRKVLMCYRNVKFFPESMPSDNGEGWEMIPLPKFKEKSYSKEELETLREFSELIGKEPPKQPEENEKEEKKEEKQEEKGISEKKDEIEAKKDGSEIDVDKNNNENKDVERNEEKRVPDKKPTEEKKISEPEKKEQQSKISNDLLAGLKFGPQLGGKKKTNTERSDIKKEDGLPSLSPEKPNETKPQDEKKTAKILDLKKMAAKYQPGSLELKVIEEEIKKLEKQL